jgi:hypothetical protein
LHNQSIAITGYQPHPAIEPLLSSDVTPECSRAFNSEFVSLPNNTADAECLVTRLDYTAVATVPEPATVALTGLGLLALGGAAARRRA